ncbi:uncharacterized protein LOC141697050 [Apium graveolens]|uniref:uncharacterized protein LOC141697050 n=1 Tax=Apium graveolens TaxID=4045 RepID=UPI003D7B1158
MESKDDSYVDIINDGPPYPTKVIAMTTTVLEHYIRKEKSEWSDVEKDAMLKDAKIGIILHNSLNNVMSNMVIYYKTAKAIWDALKTQCQGTLEIKKNRRDVLVQEYEQFDAKSDETITDIYDRFMTLFNDLSFIGKEYDKEDSNRKFLRALPEEWDTQISIIMYQYDLDHFHWMKSMEC